jgi:hypothetical protein
MPEGAISAGGAVCVEVFVGFELLDITGVALIEELVPAVVNSTRVFGNS